MIHEDPEHELPLALQTDLQEKTNSAPNPAKPNVTKPKQPVCLKQQFNSKPLLAPGPILVRKLPLSAEPVHPSELA